MTYISGIGYDMFHRRQQVLTEEELRQVHLAYCEKYDLNRDFGKTISDLITAEILVESPARMYKFKYPYILYYSAAKFLQDNAVKLRSEIHQIADFIYNDINTNVLIFYVYLTKDQDLIAHVIKNSKLIYAEYQPCNLSTDVEFLNKMYKTTPPPLELTAGTASANRDLHNRQRDQAEETQGLVPETAEIDLAYDISLQEIVKLAISYKTLQTLGQILRNFAGSLEGPLKLEITQECYSLGMRTLHRIISIASNVDVMRQYLGRLIKERTGIIDRQELAGKTEDAIIWLGAASAFGQIKRISHAVGHSDLTNTYGKVLERNSDLATEMIDAAIKLDHFDRAPEKELKILKAKVRKNPLAAEILRDLVAEYLYLYSVDFPTMQTLGAMWDIKVSAPSLLSNRSKKS